MTVVLEPGELTVEIARDVDRRLGHHRIEVPAGARWVGVEELLGDDAAALRREHQRLCHAGTPPGAAATYLAGWYAGAPAELVAYGLAAGGLGHLVDASRLRWLVHPDGWPLHADGGPDLVVAADHPGSRLDGVATRPDAATVLTEAVLQVVEAVTPVIDACHGLARVGRPGLWNEVGDAMGRALAFRPPVPATERRVAVVDAAVRVGGVPWRATPRLAWIESATLGRVHVAQKGGCCLAYTAEPEPEPEPEPDADGQAAADADPLHRAFRQAFPRRQGEPDYCATCSLRTPADSDARQLWWRERGY